MQYNDEHETCDRTFLTLRIYTRRLEVDQITQKLKLEPTNSIKKGQKSKLTGEEIDFNGWFFSTEHKVQSKDTRRHIDFLTDLLIPLKNELESINELSIEMDLFCFWRSTSGQGGPRLSAKQFEALSKLGIELGFDFY